MKTSKKKQGIQYLFFSLSAAGSVVHLKIIYSRFYPMEITWSCLRSIATGIASSAASMAITRATKNKRNIIPVGFSTYYFFRIQNSPTWAVTRATWCVRTLKPRHSILFQNYLDMFNVHMKSCTCHMPMECAL